MSGSLSRSDIMKLFGELSEELERRGLRGHIYIVGGAALIAGYGRRRSTRDVDARIVYEKQGVTEAARQLAYKHDLPANWLNENATLFIPHKDDSQATTVYNSPSLVVTGASAKHLLAMKIDAGRREDVDDMQWLLEQLGIDDIEEAIKVHRDTYPYAPLSTTSRNRLGDAIVRTAEPETPRGTKPRATAPPAKVRNKPKTPASGRPKVTGAAFAAKQARRPSDDSPSR